VEKLAIKIQNEANDTNESRGDDMHKLPVHIPAYRFAPTSRVSTHSARIAVMFRASAVNIGTDVYGN
jgi:hypothetical protein